MIDDEKLNVPRDSQRKKAHLLHFAENQYIFLHLDSQMS